jgi:2-dehydropantoate 2-reductase
MGGTWAGRLSEAGLDVVIVDVAADLVAAIRSSGLTVETADATITTHPEATTDPTGVGHVDVVFVFVKAPHTRAAAALAQPIVGSATTLVSLQNGWGNADALAETFAAEQMVVGVTYHSATVRAPGHIAHTGAGPTFLGPFLDGGDMARAESVAAILSLAGIEPTVTASVKTEIWRKVVLNAGTLPTAALTGLTAGELGRPGPLLDLVDGLASEAVAVAIALGHPIEREERLDRIHQVLLGAGPGKASMLQDVEGHRMTEIDVINGAVVRNAELMGVDVPLNRAMVALIHGLESSWVR